MTVRGPGARIAVTLALVVAIVGTAGLVWLPQQQARAQDRLFDAGQERHAVFPVYDGFARNDDGSLTLSFAYFSHNSGPVEIAPGDDNFFSPGPPDLGQPTRFLPGHHRWQCVLVVDGDFAGDLTWTVRHAGTTTSTSDSMLQYNWEFSDRDLPNALRFIDDAAAQPRHVCLNRPPIVRVLGYGGERGPHEVRVSVGAPLKLFGSVRDEGLPRSGTLVATWSKLSGPGDVEFDAPDEPRTIAVFSEPGAYTLQLAGSDSELERTTEVTVVVVAAN